MNTFQISIVAAALVASGAGFARTEAPPEHGRATAASVAPMAPAPSALHGEDGGSFYFAAQATPSGNPREPVLAELADARASGELALVRGEVGSQDQPQMNALPMQLTRSQVVAELLAARTSGEIDTMTREDSGSFALAQRPPYGRTAPDGVHVAGR